MSKSYEDKSITMYHTFTVSTIHLLELKNVVKILTSGSHKKSNGYIKKVITFKSKMF